MDRSAWLTEAQRWRQTSGALHRLACECWARADRAQARAAAMNESAGRPEIHGEPAERERLAAPMRSGPGPC